MKNTVTYEPDNSLKKGYISIFKEIVDDLKRNKWLTYQLFKRDFFAMYKQSLFGIFWAFIVPFISVGTFIILNRSGVFSAGDTKVPYPLYAILSTAFWYLFSTGLVSSADSLVRAGDMITKINFSKKSIVIAAFGQSIISFLIQLILVAVLLAYYKIIPSRAVLFIPVVIVPLLLLTLGLGFICALSNGVVRDISKALPMLITFLMFLTPVLYAKPQAGILAQITKFNPLFYLISAARDLILTGKISEYGGFLISSVISFIIFIICLVLFHLTETRISERI